MAQQRGDVVELSASLAPDVPAQAETIHDLSSSSMEIMVVDEIAAPSAPAAMNRKERRALMAKQRGEVRYLEY